MSTADAVEREANWLTTFNPADGLPALLKSNGGPWDIVQAYWSPSRSARQTRFYLVRGILTEDRFAAPRRMDHYTFTGKLYWPVGATTNGPGMWEAEQAAFDAAINLVLARVRGVLYDHTHGGQFLSVAEAPDPGRISVHFVDPEAAQGNSPAELRATITYEADDRDFTA